MLPVNSVTPYPPNPAVPTASPEMALKLTVNRAGRLTSSQRRLALITGLGALILLLCPLALLVQVGAVYVMDNPPIPTLGSVIFTAVAVLLLVMFVGLIGVNVDMFLPEGFMRRPVRVAHGPLEIHISEGHRPELPFSYIIGDYSFAPFLVPDDLPMRVGAPYAVYYAARSRLLLSIFALDAPDAGQWLPQDLD